MADSTAATQRHYRAPCPGCGAPVVFRSAQSTHAVCAYCQSTVVRQGEVLARIGKMAELFDDFSPLQLGVTGRHGGQGFVLLGRLQYQGAEGRWTEWQALFDDGSSGFLSEDDGAYVMALPATMAREVPAASQFRVGATTAIQGRPFSVASNGRVSLVSAQGELPHLPPLGQPFDMVELRSTDANPQVLSIDYGSSPPTLSLGRAVLLDDLKLAGLRGESGKDEKARQFDCPHCGAPVSVELATSKSVTCSSCHSVIDVSQGVGGELRHALQDEPVEPLIPLGSTAKLLGADWQVVGFQHRMGQAPGEDEQFGWSEYLLFNTRRGFIFLVDSEEGWSLVKPTTGAPTMTGTGQSATYLGTRYTLKYSYNAETTYVAGEFYWQVQRGQKTFNRDYAAGSSTLSLEQSPAEVVWSSGSAIAADAVAAALGQGARTHLFKRADAAPAATGMGCFTLIAVVVVIILLLWLLRSCSQCDPNVQDCSNSASSGSTYRSSGGSYGGYSSGGGHK